MKQHFYESRPFTSEMESILHKVGIGLLPGSEILVIYERIHILRPTYSPDRMIFYGQLVAHLIRGPKEGLEG